MERHLVLLSETTSTVLYSVTKLLMGASWNSHTWGITVGKGGGSYIEGTTGMESRLTTHKECPSSMLSLASLVLVLWFRFPEAFQL
jgi:hypothetical protein